MARGDSGRVVIEIAPELKRELYAALALSGSTLKDWFVRNAEDYCSSAHQSDLFGRGRPAEQSEQAASQNAEPIGR